MSTLGKLTNKARMGDLVSFVQGGVSNMMSGPSKDLKVARLVESIMDTKASPETERYLYFDPKVDPHARAKGQKAYSSTRSK